MNREVCFFPSASSLSQDRTRQQESSQVTKQHEGHSNKKCTEQETHERFFKRKRSRMIVLQPSLAAVLRP